MVKARTTNPVREIQEPKNGTKLSNSWIFFENSSEAEIAV
jgi:hypothetical protein